MANAEVREIVAKVRAARNDAEAYAALANMPDNELAEITAALQKEIEARTPRGPLKLASLEDGGLPLRDELGRRLSGDAPPEGPPWSHDTAPVDRVLDLIEVWRKASAAHSRPTIPQVAGAWGVSIATVNRRLAEFRAAFPTERTPDRILAALADAADLGSTSVRALDDA